MADYDIIVIGAGAAGLLSARELSTAGKKVLILEAREYVGGRAHSVSINGFNQMVETGAEFVHGNLPITLQLLKEAGINYKLVEGEMIRVNGSDMNQTDDFVEHSEYLNDALERVKQDMSVQDFIDKFLDDDKYASLRRSIQTFIEGYEAADITRASILGMKSDLMGEGMEEDQYRIVGGYSKLMNDLAEQCRSRHCDLLLKRMVTKVEWEKKMVSVYTQDGKVHTCSRLLVTIPAGVMQSNSIARPEFIPQIKTVNDAFEQLGYGYVLKIALQFNDGFWLKVGKIHGEIPGFIFSDRPIPTWWTQYPNNKDYITGWLGGPQAKILSELPQEDILQKALGSLADILSVKVSQLQNDMIGSFISDWSSDPYAQGAYSYVAVNDAEAIKSLNMPVEQTIFFAGEHLYSGPWKGTVEAAFQNSLNVVKEILNSYI